ncbi:OmpA family protein [Aeromicrobium senzhongii]|uniref:OmpA family protein n=1 Tax=Aeromicrobium senzhongii TaxID=2663859 RepID=A0ABX6SRB2_9ACTN|nr:OmpA family protein [Aeromicrobium senzhongii]QNL93688.1 OmpA family protein [Aeromicrobium senzhongii]
MLANLAENLSASSDRALLLGLTAVVFGFAAFKAYRGYQLYGTLTFVSAVTKWTAVVSALLLVLQVQQASRPYTPPPSNEFAIVLGHTQNSPRPTLGRDTSELIEESLLLHKGETAEDILSSIAFVSAAAPPTVLSVDAKALALKSIGTNATRAKRDVRDNARALETFLETQKPASNGADYLGAVIEASRNLSSGATITVIGSGLSDSGDLDFANDNLLTSAKKREAKVEQLAEKYGRDYLSGYSLHFVGLGDTTKPQERLSPKQKDIVRGLYKDVATALGGRVHVSTRTQSSTAVDTAFTVSTTDTGCGNVDFTLGEGKLEFVSDQADFTSPTKAKKALRKVVTVYQDDPARVRQITVDGYIYLTSTQRKLAGAKDAPLSRERAIAVKKLLVREGVPANLIRASGKGAGPHNNADKPGLDRMVKIKIARTENPDC